MTIPPPPTGAVAETVIDERDAADVALVRARVVAAVDGYIAEWEADRFLPRTRANALAELRRLRALFAPAPESVANGDDVERPWRTESYRCPVCGYVTSPNVDPSKHPMTCMHTSGPALMVNVTRGQSSPVVAPESVRRDVEEVRAGLVAPRGHDRGAKCPAWCGTDEHDERVKEALAALSRLVAHLGTRDTGNGESR
jgi:hypothetical protein